VKVFIASSDFPERRRSSPVPSSTRPTWRCLPPRSGFEGILGVVLHLIEASISGGRPGCHKSAMFSSRCGWTPLILETVHAFQNPATAAACMYRNLPVERRRSRPSRVASQRSRSAEGLAERLRCEEV